MSKYSFIYNNKAVHGNNYGENYVSEFCRVIDEVQNKKTNSILEYGSGITSLILLDYCTKWNSSLFVTVDNNKEYQEAVFFDREMPTFFKPIAISLSGECKSDRDLSLNYSTCPLSFGTKFDIIFIDGRRRLECAFIAAILSHESTTVVLHDYRRLRYQPALSLFDIIEDGSQFRTMRLKYEFQNTFNKKFEMLNNINRMLDWYNVAH